MVYLLSRNRRLRELEDEMEFHREMTAQSGSPERKRSFGNSGLLQERAREAWGWTWIDRLLQDLRYAVRMLARSPGFTFSAVLVLAIGVGVNVAAFSAFNFALWQPLPIKNPDTLLRLQRRSPENIVGQMPYPTAIYYRDHARTLSAVLTMAGTRLELENEIEPVRVNFIGANYFEELGARPAYGRFFASGIDDARNAAPTAVIGYEFWQSHFAADPTIVGRTIHVSHKQVTVVGVEPYAFPSLRGNRADIWMPVTQQPYVVEGSNMLTDISDGTVEVWGRLAPGATAKMAEAELLNLTNERRTQYPKEVWKDEYIHSDPGARMVTPQPPIVRAIAIFSALTLLILMVACANLGGLLLARGVVREHEIGIRMAIGASRKRIFRQLFTESLLLALMGSAVGLALACAAVHALNVLSDGPKWMSASPDWRVIIFTLGIAMLTSLLFGFAPALQLARQKQRKTMARRVLVGAQVAASCVLLIVSSLLVRATQHMLYTDPGFGYEQVISISPHLDDHGYKPAAARAYLSQLTQRLRSVPGAASVSLVKIAPLGRGVTRIDSKTDGKTLEIYPNWVMPEFFGTMQIPILLGRNFLPDETNAVIVSQSLAQKQWPGENPIGKIYWDKDIVVGVAGNARVNALNESDAVEIYAPAQEEDMPAMSVVLRTQGAPKGLTPMCKSTVQDLDAKLFPEINLLKTGFDTQMRSLEIAVSILSGVGLLAVALAAVGIVGLVAFTISQRSKEIAIRLALGSPKSVALGAVLRQYVWPVVVGLLAGFALTAACSQWLRFILFGVNNLDPWSYAVAMGILLGVVAMAALMPARRALQLDIARALHEE